MSAEIGDEEEEEGSYLVVVEDPPGEFTVQAYGADGQEVSLDSIRHLLQGQVKLEPDDEVLEAEYLEEEEEQEDPVQVKQEQLAEVKRELETDDIQLCSDPETRAAAEQDLAERRRRRLEVLAALGPARRGRVERYEQLLLDVDSRGPPPLVAPPYERADNMFRCLLCEKTQLTEKGAIKHYRNIHGEKFNCCLACDSAYRRRDTLLSHEQVCKAPFADHMRTARYLVTLISKSGVKMTRQQRRSIKIPCPICKKHICKPNMKLHTLTHSEVPRYGCTMCSARFRTSRSLYAHQNAHIGKRPFQCDECPRAYTSDTALRAHKMDHREDSYTCELCGKGFTRKHSLKIHMRTHTCERPYACGECGKRFLKRPNLKIHVGKHMGLLPEFTCTDCGKGFGKISNLKAHMKNIHKVNIITRKMFYNKLPQMSNEELKRVSSQFTVIDVQADTE